MVILHARCVKLGIKYNSFSSSNFILPSVVVMLAFIICWLPYHIGRNLFAQVDDYETAMLSQKFNMASMVLCYLSASINPVVYNLMSRKYRAAAKRLFIQHHHSQRQACAIDRISNLNESLTGVWGVSTHFGQCFNMLVCLHRQKRVCGIL